MNQLVLFLVSLTFLPMAIEDFKDRSVHVFLLFLPYVAFALPFLISTYIGILSLFMASTFFGCHYTTQIKHARKWRCNCCATNLFHAFCAYVHYYCLFGNCKRAYCIYILNALGHKQASVGWLYWVGRICWRAVFSANVMR